MAMEEGFEKLDLSGKLIIKAAVGDDIRRIPIHNDDLTYDELVLMMQRVFKSVISPDDDLLLKYKDEDGDLVTITDSGDLSFAIQYCRVLKLSVLVNPETHHANTSLQDPPSNIHRNVVKELISIRDRVTHLLDTIHSDTELKPTSDVAEVKLEDSTELVAQDNLPKITTEGREFDPLTASEDDHSEANQVERHACASHEPPTPTTNPSLFSAPTSFPQQPASQPDQSPPEIPPPAPASSQLPAQPYATQQNYLAQPPTSYQPTPQQNYPQETPQSSYPSQTPSVPQPSYTPTTSATPSVPRPSYVPPQTNYPSYNSSATYPTQTAPVGPPTEAPKAPSGPPASSYPGQTVSSTYPSNPNNTPSAYSGPPSASYSALPSSSASFPSSTTSYPGVPTSSAYSGPPASSTAYPGAPSSTAYPGAPASSYPAAGQTYPSATPAAASTYPGGNPAYPGAASGYSSANTANASGYPSANTAVSGYPSANTATGINPYSSGRPARYAHPTNQSYN